MRWLISLFVFGIILLAAFGIPCYVGKYGKYCPFNCNTNCVKSLCYLNGSCIGRCKSGWKGVTCEGACEDGTYGQDCSKVCGCCLGCTCNKVNGSCPKCAPGYYPPLCNETCQSGLYGENCLHNCSGNCLDSEPCNAKTGACDAGCAAGYTGTDCNAKCTPGLYGKDCQQICSGHCYGNSHCNAVNGYCEDGCDNGWSGVRCNLPFNDVSKDLLLGVGIAREVGIIVALIIAVAVGFLIMRKLRHVKENPDTAKPGRQKDTSTV